MGRSRRHLPAQGRQRLRSLWPHRPADAATAADHDRVHAYDDTTGGRVAMVATVAGLVARGRPGLVGELRGVGPRLGPGPPGIPLRRARPGGRGHGLDPVRCPGRASKPSPGRLLPGGRDRGGGDAPARPASSAARGPARRRLVLRGHADLGAPRRPPAPEPRLRVAVGVRQARLVGAPSGRARARRGAVGHDGLELAAEGRRWPRRWQGRHGSWPPGALGEGRHLDRRPDAAAVRPHQAGLGFRHPARPRPGPLRHPGDRPGRRGPGWRCWPSAVGSSPSA